MKQEEVGKQKERVVLVFDVGTQSTRTMLVNNRGEVLGIVKEKYEKPYWSDHPDWAEQDPDEYYRLMCKTCRKLKERYSEIFQAVEGVSLTTIRDTVICLDKNRKPLRPAILWLDKRRALGKPKFSQVAKVLLKTVGMEETANTQYAKSHCNWIREQEPTIWEKTDQYVMLGAYLHYKMTGKLVEADASLVGHLPIDSQSRHWQNKGALTRPVFPVEQEKLCGVVKSGEVVGRITAQMAEDSGLPEHMVVYATGSDKACEIVGMGCVTAEKAAIGLGTTATITYMSRRYVEPEKYIPPYPALIPGRFNPEIEIFRGYWLISWFTKEFAAKEVVQAKKMGISPEELLNQSLQKVPAGCEGLLFQPYFTPNITMPTARGAMIGFSDCHTRIHLYRAIIEGINFALYDGMKQMEKSSGHFFKELHLAGGGSQSDEICQITANMFGLPVVRTQSYEATGVGCALGTFVAMGEFLDYEEAVAAMVHEQDRFEPEEKEHAVYLELYQDVFKDIYRRLSPLYTRLHQIYHRQDY